MVLFETEQARFKGMNYIKYIHMCMKDTWLMNPCNGVFIDVLRPFTPLMSAHFSHITEARAYIDDLYDDIKRAHRLMD